MYLFFKTLSVLSGLTFAILLYMVIWFLGEPSIYGTFAEAKVLPVCIVFGIAMFIFDGKANKAEKNKS